MMFRRANEDTAALFEAITSDVYTAMDLIGAQVADSWQERISVDVEYEKGSRGGVVIVRSKRGEPPRRESGDLYRSIQSRVEADAQVLTLDVDTDIFYAPILEEKLDRPYVRATFDEWVEPVFDAIVHAVGK